MKSMMVEVLGMTSWMSVVVVVVVVVMGHFEFDDDVGEGSTGRHRLGFVFDNSRLERLLRMVKIGLDC